MSIQLPVLGIEFARSPVAFDEKLGEHGIDLRSGSVETLQINVGKLCNQACRHCHVDAGPKRTEVMTPETAEACLEAVRRGAIRIVDITGGAPEMCPSFRRLVEGARAEGARVMVRHNLTVMFEPAQEDLPEFFRDHGVEGISALPGYLEDNVDRQRGTGVYTQTIDALKGLTAVVYVVEG